MNIEFDAYKQKLNDCRPALDGLAEEVSAFSSHAAGMPRPPCELSESQWRRDILIVRHLKTELRILHLLGLEPEIEAESGAFTLRGERRIPISPEVAACIRTLVTTSTSTFSPSIALDALRSVGVYYDFHVDGVSDVRRAVLRMIHNKVR